MKDRERREVLVLTQYYSPEPIGTAPYAADLAEWLAAADADVQVLTNRPFYPGTEIIREYRDGSRDREVLRGVSLRRLDPFVPSKGAATERFRSDIGYLLRGSVELAKRTLRCRPRVVSFCPSVFTVILGSMATARGGRHIAVVHDIQSGLAAGLGFRGAKWFVRALRLIEAAALNRADAVVVLSPEMGRRLRDLGVTAPIVELPIWVDTRQIQPRARGGERPPTLLYSGNLGRKQGLPMLLDLAEQVAAPRPDVRIVVRGAGNQAEAIQADVRRRGLSNIQFAPLVPKDRLDEALAEGDVHLVPQDPNAADFALPSKLYTIMAAGRAAVATARPGSALWRLAEETRAFICVLPERPNELARTVLDLLDNEQRRSALGAAGRLYVENVAAKELVLGQYAELIYGGAR